MGKQAAALGSQAKGAISSALLKGAKVIVPAAKAKAPRSAQHRQYRKIGPKHLADAIVAQKGNARTSGVSVEGGANGSYYYWKFLEHGTGKMDPQPFIAPAAEEKESEVIDTIAGELKSKLGL